MARLERWLIVGDGLVYKIAIVLSSKPLTGDEVMKMIRTENAVVTIFDALTEEFLRMAYVSAARKHLEEVVYDFDTE